MPEITDPNLDAHGNPVEPATEKGFPSETPVADMTAEQQAAYHRFHSRKHEDRAKAYEGGLTAVEAKALQDRIDAFEAEKLTDQERAVAQAVAEAKAEAKAEAEAALVPKLREMQVRSCAAEILTKDQLAAWLPTTNLAYFVGESGEVDEKKLSDSLTAMFGAPDSQRQQRDWGQFRNGDRKVSAGESGIAEAERRFGAK